MSALHPLYSLLRTGQSWKWCQSCEEVYKKVNKALVDAPILAHYDPDLPAGNTTIYEVGAVISHTMPDGTERQIVFASRTLSTSERNYSQVDNEELSLVFGIKKFEQYLYGHHFMLRTDHKPHTTILGPKLGIPSIIAAQTQRWALLLSAYSYNIRFRPTQAHGNTDSIYHLTLAAVIVVDNSNEPAVFIVRQIGSLPVGTSEIATATYMDPVLSKVLVYMRRGWLQRVQDALRLYWLRRNELTVEQDVLLWGMREIISLTLCDRVLQELHRSHQGIARMKSLARSHVW